MKLLFAVVTAVLLCGACAEGGSGPSSGSGGSITMYGTIDEGVSFHN
ncbi:hypothetical protein [Paraburkholderia sp. C35]|nr:hypothetical protein [Paraburkholderia sp. C35]